MATATTATAYGCSPVLPSAGFRANSSACALPPCRVSVASFSMPRVPAPSFRVSCTRRRAPAARVAACSSETNSDATASPAEATVDLKLPRRSLLVQFTCDACGERTKRLINRVAYERGTVFLQCAGCQVYHKFVDNLGLVVEYDLREENVHPNDEG